MAYDGLVLHSILDELNKKLAQGKVEKIYQPEAEELVLHIHSRTGKYKLFISCASSSARVCLTEEQVPNPPSPLAFCMLLRKHLQGGRLTEITQKGFERILEIPFETVDELGFRVNKKLIIEIMGKHSKVILVESESGKILDSIKRISIDVNRYRQLLPGKVYTYPPSQDKVDFLKVTEEELKQLEESSSPENRPKNVLKKIQGISPLVAEDLCYGKGLLGNYPSMAKALSEKSYSPSVYLDEKGHPVDFHAFRLQILEDSCQVLQFDSISQACQYFYSHKDSTNRVKQKSSDLEKAIKSHLDKLYLKKKRLGEDLLKAENSDNYRLYGELITANLHMIKPGDSVAKLLNYYDGSQVEIPLDKRFSPSKNAQSYFKRYGKAKTAIKEKNLQLEETQQDIDYLESVQVFVENAQSLDAIEDIRNELVEAGYLRKRKVHGKPEKTKPRPYTYVTSDGFTFKVGRNNKENDYLTCKLAGNKDIWLHTKDIPGSHVIVFTEGREITETAIFEAAAAAAYHSKGRESENVPVDYVQAKHVKKPKGAKPGMVIFTGNRTVYVTPALPAESKQ